MKDIILASASPRRIEILRSHGIEAAVMPADVDEIQDDTISGHIVCMYNALKKALYTEKSVASGIIVAADTVVYDGRILGKPADEEDAFKMLCELRNRTHSVMTGVALIDVWSGEKRAFYDRTEVTFGDYSDDDIRAYIASGEPMDKAGSYAIQGSWSQFVTLTVGDYFNVIGLPWTRLRAELDRFGAFDGE